MNIEKVILSNFRCFAKEPIEISLEPDLTCLVGNNGSGKTTLILAIKRLFGTTMEDRTITRDDFYLNSDEDYKNINGRELYIEVIFSFPELKGDPKEARKTCPAFSSVIYAAMDGELKARMRLEAQWDETEYEDEVRSHIYWVNTSEDVAFGEGKDFKFPASANDRKKIKLRYIPAFRDSKATLRNEVKLLTKILEDYTEITTVTQNKIEKISKKLSAEVQNLDSIKATTALLKETWTEIHDQTLKHYQEPKLVATSTEIGELLRSISVKLAPSESGGSRDIIELSDGQISLLYFTLSIVLYDIEQKHYAGKLHGYKVLDKDIAVLTIFAFEEPENHLSPYYLGKVLKLLLEKTNNPKAIGIVTSHSSSVVRRMNHVEQIRHFRQVVDKKCRYSIVKEILLPSNKSDEVYKYINQAVLAHPELYFSKLVILGEGDSEEIVIPRLARALGFDLDPSFVAFVRLGGRHVNHMWKLLSELNIPFLTLIDLDLGRNGAGPSRIKYIINELDKTGKKFSFPKGITAKKLQQRSLSFDQLKTLVIRLEKYGVFYSFPLDLDMAMIRAYPAYYEASGARNSDREVLDSSVLGEKHDADEYDDNGYELYSDEELKVYRYLFCNKSKVASHYQAIANILELEKNDIEKECPDFIKRLIDRCSNMLSGKK